MDGKVSLLISNVYNVQNEQLFCGLHFLVALADSCSATLCQWESAHEEETSTQSGTLRLIRTACKAVQKQCSQKAGCHDVQDILRNARNQDISNIKV